MVLRELIGPVMEKNGVTQGEMAKKMRKSPQLVSMTMSRKVKNITIRTLESFLVAAGGRLYLRLAIKNNC